MVPDYVEEEALFFGPCECCLRNSYSVSLFSFSFSPIRSLYFAGVAIVEVLKDSQIKAIVIIVVVLYLSLINFIGLYNFVKQAFY